MTVVRDRTRGLECKLGHGRVVLPADEIDQLGEYAVGAPLPISDRIGCAIGVWAGDPIVSISLSPHTSLPSRNAHGVLLLAGDRKIRWALEIERAVAFVEIDKIAKGTPSMPWRCSATLSDQRSALFIDVRMMVSTLERGST